jgi:NTP pyrophosphatase (non-canonical NTP hydrolase)
MWLSLRGMVVDRVVNGFSGKTPCLPRPHQARRKISSHLSRPTLPPRMHDDATMLHHPDALTRLRYVVHRLRAPGGCPWDMEQTHESLIPHVIEEAYEVAEAIRGGDPAQICDELGDILLQPVLHAEIASESGAFDLDKMAHGRDRRRGAEPVGCHQAPGEGHAA